MRTFEVGIENLETAASQFCLLFITFLLNQKIRRCKTYVFTAPCLFLLKEKHTSNLLFVGAYRSNEVTGDDHPFRLIDSD